MDASDNHPVLLKRLHKRIWNKRHILTVHAIRTKTLIDLSHCHSRIFCLRVSSILRIPPVLCGAISSMRSLFLKVLCINLHHLLWALSGSSWKIIIAASKDAIIHPYYLYYENMFWLPKKILETEMNNLKISSMIISSHATADKPFQINSGAVAIATP